MKRRADRRWLRRDAYYGMAPVQSDRSGHARRNNREAAMWHVLNRRLPKAETTIHCPVAHAYTARQNACA